MRKNVLALSIAAMIGGLTLAGAASAGVVRGTGAFNGTTTMTTTDANSLALTTGGIGHILVVPYFTAQSGNATIISLVNTDTTNGKAVKIRFRGASNSDDILDFQIFMSPGDHWSGTISQGSTGFAQLVTNDKTCTLPALTAGVAQAFVPNRLNPNLSAADQQNNTREGYVEVFNMADIPPNTATNSFFTAIKHVNGTPPCTAATLNGTLTDRTTEGAAATAGFDTPSTGLFGNWTIINVPQTTTYSGPSIAVSANNTGANNAPARGAYVLFPQSASNATTPDNFTADASLRTANVNATKTQAGAVTATTNTIPVIAAAFYDLPDLSTPYITDAGLATAIAGAALGAETAPRAQASILTTAMAVQTTSNEYATDASITAYTDWVFSMPTRRYSVALDYRQTTPARVFSVVPSASANVAATGKEFFFTANTTVTSGQICVNADSQSFYDREETTRTSGAVFSPGNVSVTRFCGETSVLSFAATGLNSALAATVARQDTGTSAFTNGWGQVTTVNGGPGLPITGSAFIKASNPAVSAGVSGTYGITSVHRNTRLAN